jgi:hypothetical protein
MQPLRLVCAGGLILLLGMQLRWAFPSRPGISPSGSPCRGSETGFTDQDHEHSAAIDLRVE